MACITTIDPLMDGARGIALELVKIIIQAGVHFHYYGNWCLSYGMKLFQESILPEYQSYFHLHAINRNQQELVDELHQYHIGINPSDYLPVMRGVCALQDRNYADSQTVYINSAFPSSLFVYAAAGLPIISLAVLSETNNFFQRTAIPMVFSEFKNIKNYLIKKNLGDLCRVADEFTELACADNYIEEFIQFITLTAPSSVEAKLKLETV